MIDLDESISRVLHQHADATPIENNLDVIVSGGHLVRVTNTGNRIKRRRQQLLLAAAVTVLVVGGGIAISQLRATSPGMSPAATQPNTRPLHDSVTPVDPPEALFVLPNPVNGYNLANGDTSTSRPDSQPATEPSTPTGLLLGVSDGTGYTSLRSIVISNSSPLTNGEWEPIDTPTGPAYISTAPDVTVAQQRDNRWILVTTRTDQQRAIDLLDAVTVDEHNELVPNLQDNDLVVIDRYSTTADDVGYTTYYEAKGPDGVLVAVETAAWSTPLFSAASLADRIEPTDINGAQAWIATRTDPDGEWNGLIWNETPNRIVAVSGQTSIDAITQLAHRLRVVDETAWKTALPPATAD